MTKENQHDGSKHGGTYQVDSWRTSILAPSAKPMTDRKPAVSRVRCVRSIVIAFALLSPTLPGLCGVAAPAAAAPDPNVRADFPDKGSIAYVPPGDRAAPLLIVLAGDGQRPRAIFDAWLPHAKRAQIALFAPLCPTTLGCDGSFWRWDGGLDWLRAQRARVEKARAIDRDRTWILGWSGGGSWIGFRAQGFSEEFAAIVIHGGGTRPSSSTCALCPAPFRFIVGDKNPYHSLAKELRTALAACEHEIEWRLLPGRDHAGEWAALDSEATATLNWLAAHPRRVCEAPIKAPTVASARAVASHEPSAAAEPSHASSPPPRASIAPTQQARSGCHCGVGPGATNVDDSHVGRAAHGALLPAIALSIALRRRARSTLLGKMKPARPA
jgi:poly(3-hydroxybutyrate) depolymerase